MVTNNNNYCDEGSGVFQKHCGLKYTGSCKRRVHFISLSKTCTYLHNQLLKIEE